jgi:CRISPR/Cas system CSM-associated protein Csm4 (group 5 of RAMP superfamily)
MKKKKLKIAHFFPTKPLNSQYEKTRERVVNHIRERETNYEGEKREKEQWQHSELDRKT